ncbi:L-proline dehydrogenase /delta-1-pyrroline-5-carboxylate dehydrogenase [Albimonas donghaensis]|uniref:Bifunctional protein PutA n=1 Tax=Albimonas donghaensis TaxID=356660 RepID=A0A1H3FBA2_9RHOB|nr:bifunctional proline dehydrogenase/L-glutamate gamma-semialdehyde dehydrogenase PutA [Albimonas donghaensis]SDX88165.1 L-proline dehydrogenase /delta-1-pyrroline-5-carboxylate dehydrogenase [Albimonas donghaensis]
MTAHPSRSHSQTVIAPEPPMLADLAPDPFAETAGAGARRAAIRAATRRDERACVTALLAEADAGPLSPAIRATALKLVGAMRAKGGGSGVDGLVHEYALSSQEGVALMCLAESLLRVPDAATRDALIRDKIAEGDWRAHLGPGRSAFVNAATWGLVITGRLVSTVNDGGLADSLTRLIGRCGEPVIRAGVDLAMRMMGERFVAGQTIQEALKRARAPEARGYRHSYDMLGEAAMTAADAARYLEDYETAIDAIGKAARGQGPVAGPGVSIKLSALHPRYFRAQAGRVEAELAPRLHALAARAAAHDIGLNIDAEEADRLDLSLDLLERLAFDPALAGWDGLGFVVQAYGRRCPEVIDWIIDLARRSGRRIMVRLVKGAYWDAEIKRAQLDGLEDYPVFTRKAHTDVSYLACARRLLEAGDAVYPQFATHNAQTLAAILHMAGTDRARDSYEFQGLHGMCEPLYDEVVGAAKLDRPCRIYAPVGSHETLLAYLVRRLLENGANSSFVNRITDEDVPLEELAADPVETVRAMADPGAPHQKIAAPGAILGARANSEGWDLACPARLADLSEALAAEGARVWTAAPLLADGAAPQGTPRACENPGDRRDVVGEVIEATEAEAARALALAAQGAGDWAGQGPEPRAAALDRAADAMQAAMPSLLGLLAREAGKTMSNGIAEVREAIDFLRFYADEARAKAGPGTAPLGPVVCISPWNFPLAIFTGQVCAALAAGNPVIAKPAEETPLVAAEAVRLLHAAGVPPAALQLLPGDGRVGAALTAGEGVAAVMFTGSTEVARLIQRGLAGRLGADGAPIPLIAETGGQNAMIVDSTALPEQVVADVLASAFDSAGQRCSALRVLCLQEETADRTLRMLRGAMEELRVGRADFLRTDVGPVISEDARAGIEAHVARMAGQGRAVTRIAPSGDAAHGSYVPPALIEIGGLEEMGAEVFGPVLHVMRFRRAGLNDLLAGLEGLGYGLTFGLHTRLDGMVAQVRSRVRIGNVYVNRNTIGAVVGVQPFGGRGLSGTGPKAGGPMYLPRLLQGGGAGGAGSGETAGVRTQALRLDPAALAYASWLEGRAPRVSALARADIGRLSPGREVELPGPVGERNLYALHPRGRVMVMAQGEAGLLRLVGAGLAGGNAVCVVGAGAALRAALDGLPAEAAARVGFAAAPAEAGPCDAALAERAPDAPGAAAIRAAAEALAALPGAIVTLNTVPTAALETDSSAIAPAWVLEEVSTSINTAAAGGNASLMAIG